MKTETFFVLAMVAVAAAGVLPTQEGASCSAVACGERCVGSGFDGGFCEGGEGHCICTTRQPLSVPPNPNPAVVPSDHQKRLLRRKRGDSSCDSRCNASCWSTGIAFGGSCLMNSNVCNCNYVSQSDINNGLWQVNPFPLGITG